MLEEARSEPPEAREHEGELGGQDDSEGGLRLAKAEEHGGGAPARASVRLEIKRLQPQLRPDDKEDGVDPAARRR